MESQTAGGRRGPILRCGAAAALAAALAGCHATAMQAGAAVEKHESAGGRRSPPEIRVRRAAAPISIDGRLDEPDWKGAAEVLLRAADGSRDAGRRTSVKALHDGRRIYLAFACEDPDIWTAHRGRDSYMWTEDVVEAFIDVDPADPAYVELEVNPRGDLFDALFLDRRRKVLPAWNPDIVVAVAVDGTVDRRDDVDRSWTVEMSIPLADLAPQPSLGKPAVEVGPGTVFGVNFYRNERSGDGGEMQAWAPVRDDFHVPDLFGRMVFE